MFKEIYDDYKRYVRDREANMTQYTRILNDGSSIQIEASQIQVGHIIQIDSNQRIPADMVLIHTKDESGTVFIRTDQLDGETDWKLRKAVKISNILIQKDLSNIQILADLCAYIKIKQPIENIYDFNGVYKQIDEIGVKKKEALSLENTLWMDTVLANSQIWGIIIYTGKETRMSMNSRNPRSKFGRTDLQINFLSKLLFCLMVFMAAILILLGPPRPIRWQLGIDFFRYLILLSAVIPISLRVNLDFAKLMYSYRINKDQDIAGTIARNSNIPEELGRIQYLLTDKTGTLTQNEMIFKRLSLLSENYCSEDIEIIKQKIQLQCMKNKGPQPIGISSQITKLSSSLKMKRLNDVVLRDLVTAIALCHNVTPIVDSFGVKSYQASSPDEVALVNLAETLGIDLIKREQELIVIKNSNGDTESYKILNIFPFSSDTKRMGIIVQYEFNELIMFYLKGADVVMRQCLPENQKGFVDEECDDQARQGLRTLVFAQKMLTKQDYEIWYNSYKKAEEKLNGRKEAVKQAIAELEKNLDFIGITGVEDKLQENVQTTLENIRMAGIKTWMLTGDKIETAICIAISSRLKSSTQNIYLIKEIEDLYELQAKLTQFNTLNHNHVLVIDGTSLKLALNSCKNQFFEVASKAPAVICCRCSPTQKSMITEALKIFTKMVVCSIGDGGNDVGMIQLADIGIGIVGKEGKQAALAADYSILRFDYLNKLLLWHGRLSYKRSTLLTQFIYHRGLLIAIIEMIFICTFYFVSLQIFNSKLLLGFVTIFTMLPVFSLIFDEDVDIQTALNYPPLYQSIQKGRELNVKTFLGWLFRAIYQGSIIMLLSMLLFRNNFLEIQTIAFSTLILTEYLMTLSELHRLHIVSIVCSVISLIIYLIIWFGIPQFFNLERAETIGWRYGFRIFIVILCSWGPLVLFQICRKRYDPTDYEVIVQNVKRKPINTQIIH